MVSEFAVTMFFPSWFQSKIVCKRTSVFFCIIILSGVYNYVFVLLPIADLIFMFTIVMTVLLVYI